MGLSNSSKPCLKARISRASPKNGLWRFPVIDASAPFAERDGRFVDEMWSEVVDEQKEGTAFHPVESCQTIRM